MNKQDMKKAMKAPFSELIRSIKNPDINIELKSLNDLQSVCEGLEYLVEQRKKALIEKTVKGNLIYHKCGHCKKYFKLNPKDCYQTQEVHNISTYTDAGYGDDDRYANAVYNITKVKCPLCKKEVTLENKYSYTVPGTERDRWGRVWN